ncbi:MAG: hypothetical protein KC910_25185 [Candidatus Eremiobacteraeota bacterium]|nr:hypothetical protein [Candidatus Eremiobacteraeota bacterium]
MTLTDRDPELVLLKIDIEEPGSPVARQFHVEVVPYFLIYGPDKELIAEGEKAQRWLDRAMLRAKGKEIPPELQED